MSGFGRSNEGDHGEPGVDASSPSADDKLAFDRDGESLPWLESDEDYEDDQGIDSRRILAFALGGLALLAVLVGLMWWVTHRGADEQLVADGSTIPAPAEPYKVKPSDPGGKTFAGTGDESFAVGEGMASEGRIAPSPAQPPAKPSIAVKEEGSGVGVQVGAYSTRETAEAGWNRLVTNHEVLKGYKHRVTEGTADIGTVWRLQAVAGDVGSANQLCASLRSEGAACQVKR